LDSSRPTRLFTGVSIRFEIAAGRSSCSGFERGGKLGWLQARGTGVVVVYMPTERENEARRQQSTLDATTFTSVRLAFCTKYCNYGASRLPLPCRVGLDPRRANLHPWCESSESHPCDLLLTAYEVACTVRLASIQSGSRKASYDVSSTNRGLMWGNEAKRVKRATSVWVKQLVVEVSQHPSIQNPRWRCVEHPNLRV
jgi:hypothetical protein